MNVTLIAPPWFEVPPRGHGGIETVVATLANALARRGHDVVVHAVGGSGLTVPARASFNEAQERYLGTPDRSAVEFAHVVAAYRSIALKKPDVVHDHTGIVGAAAATTVPDVPVLCTIHKPLSQAFRRTWRLLAESPSIYVSVLSRDQRRRLDGDVPVDSVVSNGVDLDRFPVVREKQEYFVTISRICAEKAPHVAMEVARRAGQTLKIAGRVETTPEGRRYYAEEFEPRLGAGVEYLGEIGQDEKAELLGGARALLFPVEWDEPFGLVAVEALACGTPVVATPRGALPEIVVDGVHGFLRQDPEGMLDAVGQLDAIDPDVCRQRVHDHFSAEVMAAAYEQVYERAVAAAGRSRASC